MSYRVESPDCQRRHRTSFSYDCNDSNAVTLPQHCPVDVTVLLRRTTFNVAVGNADAHAKNFSLLHDADDPEIRLAPFYDVLSTIALELADAAGKAFLRYRRGGGEKRSPMPDFYIGAHAAITGYRLLTRDVRRYRTYFPTIDIIAPPQAADGAA